MRSYQAGECVRDLRRLACGPSSRRPTLSRGLQAIPNAVAVDATLRAFRAVLAAPLADSVAQTSNAILPRPADGVGQAARRGAVLRLVAERTRVFKIRVIAGAIFIRDLFSCVTRLACGNVDSPWTRRSGVHAQASPRCSFRHWILAFFIDTDALTPALGRGAVAPVAARGSLLAGVTLAVFEQGAAPADAAVSAWRRWAVMCFLTRTSEAREVRHADLCGTGGYSRRSREVHTARRTIHVGAAASTRDYPRRSHGVDVRRTIYVGAAASTRPILECRTRTATEDGDDAETASAPRQNASVMAPTSLGPDTS